MTHRYPPHYNVLNAAKTTYFIKSSKGTPLKRVSYQCASCKVNNTRKQVVVDHVQPVVDVATGFPILPNGMDDWNTYINRMFFGELQVLCKTCHNIKSKGENKERRKVKKKILHNDKKIVNIKKGKQI